VLRPEPPISGFHPDIEPSRLAKMKIEGAVIGVVPPDGVPVIWNDDMPAELKTNPVGPWGAGGVVIVGMLTTRG
jgi:hypothetical protein